MSEVKRGCKQTEGGVIPEDWEAARLGAHASFKTGPFGSTLHKSDYVDGGIPVINPMQIIDGKICPTAMMAISEEAARKLTDFRLANGDVVIGRRGDMGRCAYVSESQHGWLCGTGSMIVRTRSTLSPRFAQRILSSPQAIAAIENASVGSTMINLNQGTLGGLRIPLPSKAAEQEAIAEALSDADALIESLEQLLTKKRQIKQGAMQELLTGKKRLPGFQSKPGYKQTELGELPADWEVKQVGSLDPFVTSGSRGWAEFYSDRGASFVRITNLSRECIYLNLDDLRFVDLRETNAEAARTQLREGDVLISITADIGIAGYVTSRLPKPAYINQHIALIRFDTGKADPQFIAYFLASERPQRRFRALTDAGAKAGMNLTTIRQILLALPSALPEQTAIASVLSDMDADISSLETKLAKARQVKQGMMQNLLTGKIRLV